jgi:hypothetical protein
LPKSAWEAASVRPKILKAADAYPTSARWWNDSAVSGHDGVFAVSHIRARLLGMGGRNDI